MVIQNLPFCIIRKKNDYAVYWNTIALEYNPDDVRIQNNHQVYLQKEANPND